MVLPLTQTPGGILHYTYIGPVGVAGNPAQQTLDLTVFPKTIRMDPHFDDQLEIIVKSQDTDLSNASNLVITNDSEGLPAVATFDVVSTDATAEINVYVSVRHSVIR